MLKWAPRMNYQGIFLEKIQISFVNILFSFFFTVASGLSLLTQASPASHRKRRKLVFPTLRVVVYLRPKSKGSAKCVEVN